MKKYIIAGLHGDEPFGLKIAAKLDQLTDGDIFTKVGHPEAVEKGVRYIEEDLNRSFGSAHDCLESRLAKSIKNEIIQYDPAVILDIHTSIAEVDNVAIVASNNNFVQQLADYLGLKAVVIMPQTLVRKSLIGQFPAKSISVELSLNSCTNELAKHLSEKIANLKSDDLKCLNRLPVFEVFDYIDKNFKGLESIENLTYNRTLKGYPFLAGLKTYETTGGFLAKKIA